MTLLQPFGKLLYKLGKSICMPSRQRLGLSLSGPPGWCHSVYHWMCVCACVCAEQFQVLYNWPLRCQLQRQSCLCLSSIIDGQLLQLLPLQMQLLQSRSPGSWQCDLLDGCGALLCTGMPISAINNNGHKCERGGERERERQTVAARDMKTAQNVCGL